MHTMLPLFASAFKNDRELIESNFKSLAFINYETRDSVLRNHRFDDSQAMKESSFSCLRANNMAFFVT